MKVVGVTFNATMSWSDHIKNIYYKGTRSLYLLRRAASVLSSSAMCTIYKAFVRSQLEYCCPLWMSAPKCLLDKLDRIQNRAMKIIGKAAISLQSLSHRRDVAALCVLQRLLRKAAPSPLLKFNIIKVDMLQRRSTRVSGSANGKLPVTIDYQFPAKRSRSLIPTYWKSSCIPKMVDLWNNFVDLEWRDYKMKPAKFKKKINGKCLSMRY